MPFPGCPWPSLLQSPAPLPRMKIGWKISDFYLFWTCFDWKIIQNILYVSLDHKIRLHDITRMRTNVQLAKAGLNGEECIILIEDIWCRGLFPNLKPVDIPTTKSCHLRSSADWHFWTPPPSLRQSSLASAQWLGKCSSSWLHRR